MAEVRTWCSVDWVRSRRISSDRDRQTLVLHRHWASPLPPPSLCLSTSSPLFCLTTSSLISLPLHLLFFTLPLHFLPHFSVSLCPPPPLYLSTPSPLFCLSTSSTFTLPLHIFHIPAMLLVPALALRSSALSLMRITLILRPYMSTSRRKWKRYIHAGLRMILLPHLWNMILFASLIVLMLSHKPQQFHTIHILSFRITVPRKKCFLCFP